MQRASLPWLSLLFLLSLSCSVLPLATLAEIQQNESAAQAALEAEDIVGALEIYADLIDAAAHSASKEKDSTLALALADETEYLLLRFGTLASGLGNDTLRLDLLADIDMAPHFGEPYAILRRLQSRHADLHYLNDWSFIGPFDNERGIGMTSVLAAESAPAFELSHDGKVRTVSWRELPDGRYSDGILRLGSLIRPSTQVCALARTWVFSENAREAHLYLSVNEEIRAWCNGVAILDAFDAHTFASDMFAVSLSLKAGWNEITLKVGNRDSGLQFAARLSDADGGAPLNLNSQARAPQDISASVLSTEAAPALDESTRPGAWSRWFNDKSAEGRLRLSYCLQAHSPLPDHEFSGRAEAKASAELAPHSPRHLANYARTLAPKGSAAETDLNPWLAAIDAVLEQNPNYGPALRWRALNAMHNQNMYLYALELCDRRLALQPQSLLAAADRADVFDLLRQPAIASAYRRALTEHDALKNYPRQLRSVLSQLASQSDLFADIQAQLAATGDRGAASQIEVRAAIVEGGLTAGKAYYEQQWASHEVLSPWDSSTKLHHARSLIQEDRLAEALSWAERAKNICPDSAAVWAGIARVHLASGDFEAAADALEHELTLDFTDEKERRLLEHLRSLGASPFYEKLREPLADIVARHPDPMPLEKEAGMEILLSNVFIKVTPDSRAQRYYRMVYRILNDNGARKLDTFGRRCAAGDQEVRFLTATVHHADGEVEHARKGRSGRRGGFGMDLPALSPGDIVDFEWTLDDLRLTFFGQYFSMNEPLHPMSSLPLHESEIQVFWTDDLPIYFHEKNIQGLNGFEQTGIQTDADGVHSRSWRLSQTPPAYTEVGQPPASESASAIQATTYENWDALASWWWNLIDDQLTVSAEMSAKVAELVEGKTTKLEKLRAIYDFVVTDIRYNAWEFGVHGYEPYSAPVIFSRGFGDCKDKAILLRSMLTEVDIECDPVLVYRSSPSGGRRWEEDLSLAMVNHFNHCIAFIPEQEGIPQEMFVDGTARLNPLEELPYDDSGAQVLVVRKDGMSRMRIPFRDAEQNKLERRFTLSLNQDASGRANLETRAHGKYDPSTRQGYAGGTEKRQERAERLMGSIFGALDGAVEATFSDFEDLSAPVSVRLAAPVHALATASGNLIEIPLGLEKLDFLSGAASKTTRTTDLLLRTAWSRDTTMTWVFDHNDFQLSTLPEPISIDIGDAAFSFSLEVVPEGIRITEKFTLRTHRIPVERYGAFRDLCRTLDETQNAFFQLEVR